MHLAAANDLKGFFGTKLGSSRFIFTSEEYTRLAECPRNRVCLLPYLGGEEVNTSPTQSHDRYAIYFEQPLNIAAVSRVARHHSDASKARPRSGRQSWTGQARENVLVAVHVAGRSSISKHQQSGSLHGDRHHYKASRLFIPAHTAGLCPLIGRLRVRQFWTLRMPSESNT